MFVVQEVLHTPAAVLHAYATHDWVAGVTQALLALHVEVGVSVDPVQLEARQVVPAAYLRQAPPPLHVPSLPQVAAVWSSHWFNGSAPAGTEAHVPIDPVSAHETQVPAHAV